MTSWQVPRVVFEMGCMKRKRSPEERGSVRMTNFPTNFFAQVYTAEFNMPFDLEWSEGMSLLEVFFHF